MIEKFDHIDGRDIILAGKEGGRERGSGLTRREGQTQSKTERRECSAKLLSFLAHSEREGERRRQWKREQGNLAPPSLSRDAARLELAHGAHKGLLAALQQPREPAPEVTVALLAEWGRSFGHRDREAQRE